MKMIIETTPPSSKTTYQTSDLMLTSFLRCRGFHIENIKQNNGRTLFMFQESPELRQTILDFANDAVVAVRSLCSTMRDLKAITRVLIFFIAAAVSVGHVVAQQKSPASQKIELEGVEVEFTIEPIEEPGKSSEVMEAKEATVRFKIHDKATKTPLSGVKPSVWLTQREGETDPKACREKVQSFLQGSLRSRPDVDLNTYYLLALNDEANISVIDPLLGF